MNDRMVTGQNWENDRRKFKRMHISVPLSLQLVREGGCPAPINVETEDIAPDGLSIITKIEIDNWHISSKGNEMLARLIPYLVLDNRMVDLALQILPHGATIPMRGTVTWYERSARGGFYCLRAGISIDAIGPEHQQEWLEFLMAVRQLQNNECT